LFISPKTVEANLGRSTASSASTHAPKSAASSAAS